MNTDFIKYQTETSPYPLGMEVSHAIGSLHFTIQIIKIFRFCSQRICLYFGTSKQGVNDANQNQLDKYSHVMVYGEYSQSLLLLFCKLLARNNYLNH